MNAEIDSNNENINNNINSSNQDDNLAFEDSDVDPAMNGGPY